MSFAGRFVLFRSVLYRSFHCIIVNFRCLLAVRAYFPAVMCVVYYIMMLLERRGARRHSNCLHSEAGQICRRLEDKVDQGSESADGGNELSSGMLMLTPC